MGSWRPGKRKTKLPMWPVLGSFRSSPRTATLPILCEVAHHPCCTHGEAEAHSVTDTSSSESHSERWSVKPGGGEGFGPSRSVPPLYK